MLPRSLMPMTPVDRLSCRVLVFALTLLAPSYACAFACGGGSRFFETEVADWCLTLEATGRLDEEALRGVEAAARDPRTPRWLRDVAARTAAEAHLLEGRWVEGEAMLRGPRRSSPRDQALAATQAVFLLRLGRPADARRLAERAAQRVCDAWDIRSSSSFDEVATCRRAWGVLRATAATDAERDASDARWLRFARARAVSDAGEVAQIRRSDCAVSGEAPCAIATTEDPSARIARSYTRCNALPEARQPECYCAPACAERFELELHTPLVIRFDSSLPGFRHQGVDLELDDQGRALECRVVVEGTLTATRACGADGSGR